MRQHPGSLYEGDAQDPTPGAANPTKQSGPSPKAQTWDELGACTSGFARLSQLNSSSRSRRSEAAAWWFSCAQLARAQVAVSQEGSCSVARCIQRCTHFTQQAAWTGEGAHHWGLVVVKLRQGVVGGGEELVVHACMG